MNLDLTKECVINYYEVSIAKESWICGLLVPHGISELGVAGLTPIELKQVQLPSIAERISNLEIKIVDLYPLSNTTLYIGKTVGCSVGESLLEIIGENTALGK